MSELLKTTKSGKGRGSHDHIAYLKDDGSGYTSDSGHIHQISFLEPIPQSIDQMPESPTYGQVLNEGFEGGWQILPGPDGHLHDLMPLLSKELSDDDDPETIVQEIINLYEEAKEIEKDSREDGYECEQFVMGDQWKKKTKAALEGNDRAAMTVNALEHKLDTLSGYQRQNRMDIRFLPIEDGDQRVADILNIVSKNVLEQTNFGREETKVFEDASLVGRGAFHIYDDFARNIMGDIVVEKFQWDEIYFGPHEKEDLSDCDYIIKEKWHSISKLKQVWPKKAKDFHPEVKEITTKSTKSEDWSKSHGTTQLSGSSSDLVDTVRKQYKVLECIRKIYKRVYILINQEDEFVFAANDWSESDVNSMKSMPGFEVIPRVVHNLKKTLVTSDALLENEYIDLPLNDFNIVPVYAKKRRGKFWGKIKSVIDLQKLINKSYSQFVDILNKVVAYGWFYDHETFPNQAEERKFKKNSTSPGFTQKVNDVNHLPVKEEGIKFPNELTQSIMMFQGSIKEILNINLEFMGDSGNESGIALRQKIIQQLLGNDFIFDNLSFAKKKLGKLLVGYIQKIYTPERILRIIQNESKKEKEPSQIGGKPISEYDPQEIIQLLENTDLTKYDVAVAEGPASPTAMMSNYLLLLEMGKSGTPVPASAIIRFAPIPGKDKILEELSQDMQRQEQMDKRKYDTEIAKAQIAQQGKGNTG